MKRRGQKVVILAVGVVIMLTAGCEKENPLANENLQLKEQLEQCDKEIEKQKELLVKCLQEKKDWAEQIQESIKGLMDSAIKDLEEIGKLREENVKLKSQTEQLKTHIQQLEKELKKLSVSQSL